MRLAFAVAGMRPRCCGTRVICIGVDCVYDLIDYTSYIPSLEDSVLNQIWNEGVAPLIAALHIRGHDEALSALLQRGEAVLSKRRSEK